MEQKVSTKCDVKSSEADVEIKNYYQFSATKIIF